MKELIKSILGVESLEQGMYNDAAKEGKTFSMWLEDEKAKKGIETPYAQKSLGEIFSMKKELRKAGQKPPLTAFEEMLKAAGINAFGKFSDPVGKFYQYSNNTILFPEFWAQKIYAGLLKRSLVSAMIAEDTVIRGLDFHKLYLKDTEDQRQLRKITIGEELPETKVIVDEETTRLQKFGRYLTLAYEEIEYVPLNLFGVVLERLGLEIGIDETDELVTTLVNGDGNSNTPGTTVSATTSGSIVMRDAINWATGLPTPYTMTDFVGKKALLQEYYEALLGVGVNDPGQTLRGIGITLPTAHEWDRTSVTSDTFIGVDKSYACGRVSTGAVMTESENIIRKQVKGTAVSYRCAFHIIDKNAVAIFDETA